VKCRQEVEARRPGLLKDLEQPGTREIVEMIGPYYKAKAFEYHERGLYSRLPSAPSKVVTVSADTVQNITKWMRTMVLRKIREVRTRT